MPVLPVQGPAYPLSVCWCSCGCRCSLRVALRRPRQPWQPWRRWSWCRLPRCSVSAAAPTSSGAARRAREASARASPSSWPCTGWLPPVAWLWRGGAPPLAVSPAHRSRTSPGNTGNNSPQPPPQRKAPWKPRQTPLPPLPCHAGSREWFPWRSLRAAVPAGTDSSAAPLPLSPIPVSGRLRAKSIRLQSETKHCGVRKDLVAHPLIS